MEQRKTVNFSVIKEKIIKTDEVLNMYSQAKDKYLEANNKLKKLQHAYRDLKLNYDQTMVNIDRLQIESERSTFNLENLNLRNNELDKENEELRKHKMLLEEKYNQQTIQSQSNIRELQHKLKMIQEIKSAAETLSPKEKQNLVPDDYKERISGFEEKIKLLNDIEVKRTSEIQQLTLREKKLLDDIDTAKKNYSESIQKLQNNNNNLVKELDHLKLQINAYKFHEDSESNNSQLTKIDEKNQEIRDLERRIHTLIENKTRLKCIEEENNRLKLELKTKPNAINIKSSDNTYVQTDSILKIHNRVVHTQTVETMKTLDRKDLLQSENVKLKQLVLECNAEIIKLKAKSVKAKSKVSATQTEQIELDVSVREILTEMCMPPPGMLSPMSATSYENSNLDNILSPLLVNVPESVFKDIPEIIITPSTPVIQKNINFSADFSKDEEMQVTLNNETVRTAGKMDISNESKNLESSSQEIVQLGLTSIASSSIIEENVKSLTDLRKKSVDKSEQNELRNKNKNCEIFLEESACLVDKSVLKYSLEPQNGDVNAKKVVKPIRSKKYQSTSIPNNFVTLKRSYLKRLLNKKYVLGKELQRLKKLRKQDCILKAIRTLKDSNINFTISNEPTLRHCWGYYNYRDDYPATDFCPPLLKASPANSQPVIHKYKVAKFITEKLNCNLKCCVDSNCYMLLNNEGESDLLGFYSVKREIFTPSTTSMDIADNISTNNTKLSHSIVNPNKITTENMLETLADLVSQKLEVRNNSVPKRKRRKRDTDNSNSFSSETESEIERLFEKSNNDVLNNNKMLLQRAEKQKAQGLSAAGLVKNSKKLIKPKDNGKKNLAKYQDVPSICTINEYQDVTTSIDVSCDSHSTYLDSISPSNTKKSSIESTLVNFTDMFLERSKVMTPTKTCYDPQVDVLTSCHFIPCNESTNNGSDSLIFSACPELLSPINSTSSKAGTGMDNGKLVNFETDWLKEDNRVISSELALLNETNTHLKKIMNNKGVVIEKDEAYVMPLSNNTDINSDNIFKVNTHSSQNINIPDKEQIPATEDVTSGTMQPELSIQQNLSLENNFEKIYSMKKIGHDLNSLYVEDILDKDHKTSFFNTSKHQFENTENNFNIILELEHIADKPRCPESPTQFGEIHFNSPIIIPLENDTHLPKSPELIGDCMEFCKSKISFNCEKEPNISAEENINYEKFTSTNSQCISRPVSPKVLRRSLRNIRRVSTERPHLDGINDCNVTINDRLTDTVKVKDCGTPIVKSENIDIDEANSFTGSSKSNKSVLPKRKIGRPKKRKSIITKDDIEETDNLSPGAIKSSVETLASNSVYRPESDTKISEKRLSPSQDLKLNIEVGMSTKEKNTSNKFDNARKVHDIEEKAFTTITKNCLSSITQTSTANFAETGKLPDCPLATASDEVKLNEISGKILEGNMKSTTTKKRKAISKLKSNVLRQVNMKRKMFQNNETKNNIINKSSTCGLNILNTSDRTNMHIAVSNIDVDIKRVSGGAKQNSISKGTKLDDSITSCTKEKIHIVQNILIPANSNHALDLLHQQEYAEDRFATNCDISIGNILDKDNKNIGDILDNDNKTSFPNTSKPVIENIEDKFNMHTLDLENIEDIPSCPESPTMVFDEIHFNSPIIIPLEKHETQLSRSPELTSGCMEFTESKISFNCKKEQNIIVEENANYEKFTTTNSQCKSRPVLSKILRRSLRNIRKLSTEMPLLNGIQDCNTTINDGLIDAAEGKDCGMIVKSENIDESNSFIGSSKSNKLMLTKRNLDRPKNRKSKITKNNKTDNLSPSATKFSVQTLGSNSVYPPESDRKTSEGRLNPSQDQQLNIEVGMSTKEANTSNKFANARKSHYIKEKTYTTITKNSLCSIAQTSTANLGETSKLPDCPLATESNKEKLNGISGKIIDGNMKSTAAKKRKTMSKLKSNVLRQINMKRKMFQNNETTNNNLNKSNTCGLDILNNSDRTNMPLAVSNINVDIKSVSGLGKQNNISKDIKLEDSIPANSNHALDMIHQQEYAEDRFSTNCDIDMKQNSNRNICNIVDTCKLSVEKNKINNNSNVRCKAPIRMKRSIRKANITDNTTDILSKIMDDMDKYKPKQLLDDKNKSIDVNLRQLKVVENVPSTAIGDKEWRSGFIAIAEKIYHASNKEDSSAEGHNNNQKLLTNPMAKPSKKTKILMSKLLKLSTEENIPDEIIVEFKRYQVDNIADLILQEVTKDVNDKPDDKYYPAPLMTKTQRILLRLMVDLENHNIKMLMDSFLSKAETFLFKIGCGIRTVVPVTRLYMAICKLRADITRMRTFCWNAFYFMCDLAIPLLFTVLTSWTEVLPKEPDLKNYPLTKVLVQIVHFKGCNRPGYNLFPLRALLNQFYGYPKERWNCDEIFEESFQHYLRNPSKISDLALRLLCKNKDRPWVYTKINQFFKPLIYKIPAENVNFRATAILLISNICRQFKLQNEADKTFLVELRRWLIGLIEDGDVSDLVKRSVYLCLTRLPKNRVCAKKMNKQAKKKTTNWKTNKQATNLRKKKKRVKN